MTTFRSSAAVTLLSMLLGSSCSSGKSERQFPSTKIGNIIRLGDVDQINSRLTIYLLGIGDHDQIQEELSASGFVYGGTHQGCRIWNFSEKENKAMRRSWVGLAHYTIAVSVSICSQDISVNSGYRGL